MELHTPNNNGETANSYPIIEPSKLDNGEAESSNPHNSYPLYEDFDSTCSTPYVSAPFYPVRGPVTGFFYSAPASPMHFAITATSLSSSQPSSFDNGSASVPHDYEFEFFAMYGSNGSGTFGFHELSGRVVLERANPTHEAFDPLGVPSGPRSLAGLEGEGDEEAKVKSHVKGRDLRLMDKCIRKRTKYMSPLRNTPIEWAENEDGVGDLSLGKEMNKNGSSKIEENEREKIDGLGSEATLSVSASSSRSSSTGRSSKRWVFLKDFLYKSKSEGRSDNKFWSMISFSPTKDKKPTNQNLPSKEKSTNHSNGNAKVQR